MSEARNNGVEQAPPDGLLASDQAIALTATISPALINARKRLDDRPLTKSQRKINKGLSRIAGDLDRAWVGIPSHHFGRNVMVRDRAYPWEDPLHEGANVYIGESAEAAAFCDAFEQLSWKDGVLGVSEDCSREDDATLSRGQRVKAAAVTLGPMASGLCAETINGIMGWPPRVGSGIAIGSVLAIGASYVWNLKRPPQSSTRWKVVQAERILQSLRHARKDFNANAVKLGPGKIAFEAEPTREFLKAMDTRYLQAIDLEGYRDSLLLQEAYEKNTEVNDSTPKRRNILPGWKRFQTDKPQWIASKPSMPYGYYAARKETDNSYRMVRNSAFCPSFLFVNILRADHDPDELWGTYLHEAAQQFSRIQGTIVDARGVIAHQADTLSSAGRQLLQEAHQEAAGIVLDAIRCGNERFIEASRRNDLAKRENRLIAVLHESLEYTDEELQHPRLAALSVLKDVVAYAADRVDIEDADELVQLCKMSGYLKSVIPLIRSDRSIETAYRALLGTYGNMLHLPDWETVDRLIAARETGA